MFISMQLISSYDIYKWERHQRKVQLTFASSHLCYLTLSHIYCVYSCSSFRQQWSENWAFPPWRVFMREFITVTVCYDISQSVARNCSFTKPLAQHDIGTTLRRSLHQDHLLDTYFHSLNMPAFVQSLKIHYRALKCNVFTDWTYQSGLVAWLLLFHSLRNSHFSEKQSASLLSRFRCAVEQRCWRISRNSYFAGREKRSHLRSAKGKCASSKTFHLPGSWVRAHLSELGVSQGWGGWGEGWGGSDENWLTCDPPETGKEG